MTSGGLTAVVGVLGALGALSGLVVFFVSRWDKKRDPVSKAEAEVALAAKALGMAEGLNDKLLREVTRLDERLQQADEARQEDRERLMVAEQEHRDDRAKIENLEQRLATVLREREVEDTKIAGLERRMDAVIADRDAIVQYFVVFRGWVANGMRPPAPSVPEHLADVIPAWVPGDGAEIPHPRPDLEETP